MEIMSCHNGRSSISIQIHKKYTSFLNSKGKYFLKHLRLSYCRYTFSFCWVLMKIFIYLFKKNSGQTVEKTISHSKIGDEHGVLVIRGLTNNFYLIKNCLLAF